MAVIDATVVASSGSNLYYLPKGPASHYNYLWDYNNDTILVPVAWRNTSSSPYASLYLYSSTDGGSNWTQGTSLWDLSSTTQTLHYGGVQVWMDSDGYIYVVCNRAYTSSPYELTTHIIHNRTGSWTKVDLSLWSSPPTLGDSPNASVDSYIWPHGDGTWDIWVAGTQQYNTNDWRTRVIKWNTNTGAITAEQLTGNGNVWSGETVTSFFGGIAPHPETGLPLVCQDAQDGSNTKILSAMRNGNGTWTDLGDITQASAPGARYGRIHVRREVNASNHLAEIFYVEVGISGWSSASHDLTGTSWTKSNAQQTRQRTLAGSLAFGETNLAGDYLDRLSIFYNYSSNIYRNYPPHTTPNTQYTSLIDKSFPEVVGELYLPGPYGSVYYPGQLFQAGFAFPYMINMAGVRTVYFYAADGTDWYQPIPYPIYISKLSTEQQILLGITIVRDGNDIVEDGTGVFIATANSARKYVYQKLEFRNDLTGTKDIDIVFTSSVGTPLLAAGTVDDELEDAVAYTYTTNTITLADVVEDGSGYVWVRWEPPAGYQTSAVGTVTHRIRRTEA